MGEGGKQGVLFDQKSRNKLMFILDVDLYRFIKLCYTGAFSFAALFDAPYNFMRIVCSLF